MAISSELKQYIIAQTLNIKGDQDKGSVAWMRRSIAVTRAETAAVSTGSSEYELRRADATANLLATLSPEDFRKKVSEAN